MAAGLGTRLRPLTCEIPKPIVPVANRPVMEHILRAAARAHGFDRGDRQPPLVPGRRSADRSATARRSGVELTYAYEEELLGTAGGVRNVADFLTGDGEPFLVMAGDALTDIDLTRAARAPTRRHDGIATLAVKQVAERQRVRRGHHRRRRPRPGLPGEARPGRGALGPAPTAMIYAFGPEIFDYFPDEPVVDFALDVFPALLDARRPVPRPRDRRLLERRRLARRVPAGEPRRGRPARSRVERRRRAARGGPGRRDRPGEQDGGWARERAGAGRRGRGDRRRRASSNGPAVIGPGARIGAGCAGEGVGAAARRRGAGGLVPGRLDRRAPRAA